jgi:hypothetical protein
MTGEIEDPVTITTIGKVGGWWVIGESSKGRKEWGPYPMMTALKLQKRLVRKFRAEGRMA